MLYEHKNNLLSDSGIRDLIKKTTFSLTDSPS